MKLLVCRRNERTVSTCHVCTLLFNREIKKMRKKFLLSSSVLHVVEKAVDVVIMMNSWPQLFTRSCRFYGNVMNINTFYNKSRLAQFFISRKLGENAKQNAKLLAKKCFEIKCPSENELHSFQTELPYPFNSFIKCRRNATRIHHSPYFI